MKILLTYDFLSTKPSLGKHLAQSLSFIQTILNALDITVIIDKGEFDQKLFLESINQTFNNQNRFEIIKTSTLNKKSLNLLKNYLYGFDLIIAYELSIESRQIFDKYEIKYIDLWLSPIRFYDDLLFNWFSNDKCIQEKLEKYQFQNEKLFVKSQTISDQFEYFYPSNINLEDNSLLLLGQLFEDRSVIKDNKFLTLLDFKTKIIELSNSYARIYLQKHPFMSEEDFKKYKEGFQNISNLEYLENLNTYALLSKNAIKKVVAISSSVLFEASYFNKEIEYLYKSVINEQSIMIYKEYFKTQFWIDILSLNQSLDIELLNYDNYFRYKINAFWAYGDLMDDKCNSSENLNYSMLIQFYNLLESFPKNRQYILYGYGSIGKLIYAYFKENIIAIIDKNLSNTTKEIDNIKIINLEDLRLYQDAWVIISPFIYNEEIIKELSIYTKNLMTLK